MQKKSKIFIIAAVIVWCAGLLMWYLRRANFAVLAPRGVIAAQQKQLIIVTVVLAMLVVIPVYILTAVIAWRYRETNGTGKYQPELTNNLGAELVWWGIPSTIILALSIITWHTSHTLDPSKPLASSKPTLNIQVVALDWKWLFIYPAQHIASVNFVEFPSNTPVTFSVTADAPMNSFWIPQLGSQIYAMPGMSTQLQAMATRVGSYAGSSANISGKGFSGMEFTARAATDKDFYAWVNAVKIQSAELDDNAYSRLAQPSENNRPAVFNLADSQLYKRVILKYMAPSAEKS